MIAKCLNEDGVRLNQIEENEVQLRNCSGSCHRRAMKNVKIKKRLIEVIKQFKYGLLQGVMNTIRLGLRFLDPDSMYNRNIQTPKV